MFNISLWVYFIVLFFVIAVILIKRQEKNVNDSWLLTILAIIITYIAVMVFLELAYDKFTTDTKVQWEATEQRKAEYSAKVEERIEKEKQTNRANGMIDGSGLFEEICYSGSVYLIFKETGSVTPKYVNDRVQTCHI